MAFTGDWVPDVTREAMRRLLAHAEKVELPNTDESTLRAFFMAVAHDQLVPRPRFQTEWRRFDLLLQIGELATVIEFKYYVQRRSQGLQGELLGFRGGPGLKNDWSMKGSPTSPPATAALEAIRASP
jgi:hypothetical protein